MKTRPTLDEYRRLLREINLPTDVISISPHQALGLRLAKPVVLRGTFPDRPFALVDGLALHSADVVVKPGSTGGHGHSARTGMAGTDLTFFVAAGEGGGTEDEEPDNGVVNPGSVSLQLRPPPSTNRREDALQPGQAVAIGIGEEVPRGADMIYPLDLIAPRPQVELADAESAEPPEDSAETGVQAATQQPEADLAPEPVRDWDLPARYADGWVEVDKIPRLFKAHIAIGAWARSRDSLIQEKTILRPADLALLDAAKVDEVEVFRKPTIGIADFSPPFPRSSSADESDSANSAAPLGTLAMQLTRSAMLPGLVLKNSPCDFQTLVRRVRHWLDQVDVLLLVGGSYHLSGCIGRDLITAVGELVVDGLELEYGGGMSIGRVAGKPVCSLPGTLPDVLVGMVLGVRPLLHRQLTPENYQDSIEVELENGSQLRVETTRAVPIRFGFDRDRQVYTSRYAGRGRDPWIDYIRGQALIVLEAGRDYSDGEPVTASLY